ncbi:glycosyltransferase family 2 protein [Haloflavibacter putidus]|uniref:Glycosyltransferase family 2 protein n=1 Tax=Haloflavibacter putidus TaxID=2576776 RepID=A0A507ZE58_9FLAO|nr:glycosyltransferase family A protein [Haloflavibacter putidus]TQD34364.1 glycosyltransferase family 2 protein [Haloflavibacter putidus]
MRFYIIIPAYNEEEHLAKTLASLTRQSFLPTKILVVDDNSTDNTAKIAEKFAQDYTFIDTIKRGSEPNRIPGAKVVATFMHGLKYLDEAYDVICKFDADLIFPENYLEKLKQAFEENTKTGMAGGFCYLQQNKNWVLESLTNKDHIRGALKAYRKKCFQEIGGLKPSMGWDTVDELLAQYHGWEIKTISELKVKHLRPTGKTYHKSSKFKQGEAFYKLRYGYLITAIAAFKLSFLKKKPALFFQYLKGYKLAKKKKLPYLVTAKEGKWIRKYRWKKIKEKLF